MPPEPTSRTHFGGGLFRGIPAGIAALLLANFFQTFAFVGLATFVGDKVYEITDNELDLAWIGLALFVPVFVFSPVAGAMSDRFDRRMVFAVGVACQIGVTAGLFLFIRSDPSTVGPIFGLMFLFGVVRAFTSPSSRALPIDLSPDEIVERVIALKAAAFQAGLILGPVVASFAAARSDELPYVVSMVAMAMTLLLLVTIVPSSGTEQLATPTGVAQVFRDAAEGVRYMRRNPVLFGAISLDLFAVLLGGAVALLPVIARDRLGVAEIGLGGLRAADGIGAAATSVLLSIRPVKHQLGRVLLGTVAIFGVFTIVLGLTRTYAVAFAAILIMGAADAVSVYIRSVIVPLATPEVMRGRILAVENVFIGGSNELGAVESGVASRFLGVVGAIVTGGIGTLAVVAIWWKAFPALRNIDTLDDVRAESPTRRENSP